MKKQCKTCGKNVLGCNKNKHKVNCTTCQKKNAYKASIAWAKKYPKRFSDLQKKYYYAHPEAIAKKIDSRRSYLNKNMPYKMFHSAKNRAKKKGIKFSLLIEDIVIPKKCPVFGIKLKTNNGVIGDSSPSLDRIIPAKGYVKNNIRVICHKANTMKSNGTLRELELLVQYLKGKL